MRGPVASRLPGWLPKGRFRRDRRHPPGARQRRRTVAMDAAAVRALRDAARGRWLGVAGEVPDAPPVP